MSLPWFRLYAEIVDDEIMQFLSFEDQRHYVWVLALKCSGVIDKEYPKADMLDVVVGRKLGLQGEALTNAKQRIMELGLIDSGWQPKGWDKRQFVSDQSDPTAAERMRRYRNGHRNATVTLRPPETDTESDTETEEIVIALPTNTGEEFPIHETQCAEWGTLFPAVNVPQELRNMRAWLIGNPAKRKTRSGMLRFVTSWLTKQQNEPRKPSSGKGRMTFADYHDGGS